MSNQICHIKKLPDEVLISSLYYLGTSVNPVTGKTQYDTEVLCEVSKRFNEIINQFRKNMLIKLGNHPTISYLMQNVRSIKEINPNCPKKIIQQLSKEMDQIQHIFKEEVRSRLYGNVLPNNPGDNLTMIVAEGSSLPLDNLFVYSISRKEDALLGTPQMRFVSEKAWAYGFVLAAKMGRLDLVKQLLRPEKNMDQDLLPSRQNKETILQALLEAIQNEHSDVITYLLGLKVAINGNSALELAVRLKCPQTTMFILNSACQISNAYNSRAGFDTRGGAAEPGLQSAIMLAVKLGALDCLKELLRHAKPRKEILELARDRAIYDNIVMQASKASEDEEDEKDSGQSALMAQMPERFRSGPNETHKLAGYNVAVAASTREQIINLLSNAIRGK